MLWPTPVDYAQAVGGFPHVSLLDPKLKDGKPKRDSTGILLVYSGGFSTVFPVEVAADIYALRCWTRDIGDAKDRYEKISAYLKQVRLPYFVDFEYVPEGILINGKKNPITRMEWIEGESPREFIVQNLQNAAIFKTLADKFQKMVADLHAHQISHGDLQNGNILLERKGTDVEIKLIDYDSLFVPALRGQPSPTPGLPEYQHPARGSLSNEKVDYFSELVIYLSFLTLAEKPVIWDQFDLENRTGDGLLFSKGDFKNPDKSDIFQELEKLSPDIQQLAATLKDFCAKTSIDQLEPLEAILPKPDANTYCNRGDSFLNAGRYDEALAEFQKAIALDPNYEKARYGIGRVYLHSKRYTDAINAFEELIKSNPNYKEAHHGLGLAYFKSGDNNKATAAANAALRIDPRYQPAIELLYTIKSTMPPPHKSKSRPDPKPDPVATLWQHITSALKHTTGVLKSNRHSVTAGTLGLTLVICFVAFLTQMDAKDKLISQNDGLKKQLDHRESEIRQKGLEIQGLTFSIQNLKSANQKLTRDNSELQKKLDNRISNTNTTSGSVINLREQLNKQKDRNQELQARLIKKDTEIRQLRNDKAVVLNENQELQKRLVRNDQGTVDQAVSIQQLQKEKTETLTKNRRLQEQLVEKTSEAKNLTEQVQQLQNEKVETQRQNQKLPGENAGLTRQNRNLRNENEALRNQLDKAKQGNAKGVVGPEPPKKIQIQNYRNIVPRAGSRNNQGCLDFERGEYDEAIKQFEQAVRTEPEFAEAHYNLGCAYLEIKKYKNAVDAFDKAVALNQKFKEAHYNLSMARFRMNTFQTAKQAVEKALSIDPNYRLAQRLLTAIENAQQ